MKKESLLIGLAMFSMFFGAGNVIFPLAVGQYAGDQNLFAILGLILTAAFMPIAGVVAMILFDGSVSHFFGRLGKWPGLILAIIIISLLGPFGSTPRCIALSYTTLKPFISFGPTAFSALACVLIFLFTIRRNHLLKLLGFVLTPLLLLSLLAIIGIGLFSSHESAAVEEAPLSIFVHGLKEGYNTMDLLAAFFFSSTILAILKREAKSDPIKTALRASVVGAILLALTYVGFSYLAAFHGASLSIEKDALLSAIALKIAGPSSGLLVCITVALACLTTAIALITAFTDFFQKEVFKEKISYEATLIGSLLVTFFISTFEFSGISFYLGPILQICYPGLIVLTFLNIAYRLKKFEPIRLPVFGAFALSAVVYAATF